VPFASDGRTLDPRRRAARTAVALDRLAAAEAEPSAKSAERDELSRGQPAHLAHQARHVPGKDLADQAAPRLGQRHGDEPTIVEPPRLLDEAATHEIGDDHRGVAVAAQELLTEIALAERTVMEQGLQHAELTDREPRPGHDPADPRGDGLGGPHQLDVSVQRDRLDRSARVPGRHGSNLKGL
jgi:hypothetical protein